MKTKIHIIQTKINIGLKTVILALMFCLAWINPINGQQHTAAVKPGRSASSFSLNGFESINPYSGNLNFSLPLLDINGRGAISSSVRLTINHKWKGAFWYWPESSYPIPYVQDYYDESASLAFDNGYSPGKLIVNHIGIYGQNEHPCPIAGDAIYLYTATLTLVKFIGPDGTEYTFRDRESNGQPHMVGNCELNDWSRGTIFHTTDGSNITFIADNEIKDKVYQGSFGYDFYRSGHILFPNGTSYRIVEGLLAWQQDRNGNFNYYSYYGSGPNYRKIHKITDSLNREILFEYGVEDEGPYGLSDRITYKGFEETTRIIRISYRSLSEILRSGYSIQTRQQLFPDIGYATGSDCNPYEAPGTCGDYVTNPKKASAVWLPDGRSYKFQYNSHAELARVETPTGSAIEYDWVNGFSIGSGLINGVVETSNERFDIYRRVAERREYHDGTNLSNKISLSGTESLGSNKGYVLKDLYDPANNLISRTKFYYFGIDGNPQWHISSEFYESWQNGQEYQTEFYGTDGTTILQRALTSWTNKHLPWFTGNPEQSPSNDPRLYRNISIVFEGNKALCTLQKSEFDENGHSDPGYFSHLNVKRTKTYHYKTLDLSMAKTAAAESISSVFTENDLAAVTEADYLYDTNYKARSLHGLITDMRVLNPANPGEVFAKSQFIYDETAYFDNSYTTTGWEDPNSSLRGNVTTTRTWHAETNSWIETHTMFDNFGNVRKVWDTSGDPDRFVETQYDPVYKYAYPTKTIAKGPDPTGVNGTSESSEINRVYDFNTGLLTSVTDAHGQTATNEYDNLLRPIRINPPAGGSVSEVIYNDTPGNIWVKSRQQIDETNWAESTTFYDNFGRVKKSRTKDLQGDVVSEVRYDSFGRVEKTSNPYRVDAGGTPTETVYWSKLRYDEANRVVETYAPAPEGQTGISLGTVEFGISDLQGLIGTYVVATDASGRKSRAISGIYGLMRLDEATGVGGTTEQDLGTLANPTQATYYNYNVKGELVKITQGAQNRYFMYDSFGRLIRVRQPEQTPNTNIATSGNPENNQWTAAYSYDILGNVVSVTDAKNIAITVDYDNAGRTIKRTYSDGTPEVEYFYDGKGLPQTPQFSRGALTKVISSVSEDRFTGFDNHGRLLASQQITDEQTYTFGYKYNLSGGLIEQTYPSGRIVRNFLDSDGGLSFVNTKAAGGLLKQVASDFDYTAAGSVRKMKLGNSLWETANIDHLGQLTQIGLGTTATNNNLFKVDYEYGELQTNGTVDATKNTGMIAKTTTTMPGTNFVQTFKYDAINRLTEAVEKTGSTQNWKQIFGYDRYGNRTSFYQIVGSTELPTNNITKPTIDPATNRFTTGQGYVYDLNGNLVQDAEGRSFTFDGDDKQTEVRDTVTNAVIGQYYYDPSGARVKKFVPATGETTIFVYDAGGALAAEYSTVSPPQEPTTSYLTTDHLGSPRVITDGEGEVISRRDFMPFGEELYAGVGPRTENLKYSYLGTDNIRQRFTGYEKDDETGLDFAEARMYQNKHGRFTAPDPLLASASAMNPQTFNRYIYTGNNPINYTDPSGLVWCGVGGSKNGYGNIVWEDGKECSEGSPLTRLDVSYTCNQGPCTIRGRDYAPGTVFRFNADGTYRAALADPGPQQTMGQGQSVEQGTANTAGTTASDAAASGAGSSGSGVPSDGMSPGSNAGLGCVSFLPCPLRSGPPIIIKLDIGASADEVLNFTQYTLEVIGMAPGLEVADAASGLISLFRGDYEGALLSAGAMAPFGGQAFTATKWARRAGRLGNAATRSQIDDIARTLKDRGYTVTNRGGPGFKEEYLPPLGGGRKGGSYVDITATHPKYGTLRINTVDTLKNGKKPTAREKRNAARIRKQIGPREHLLLIPKRK